MDLNVALLFQIWGIFILAWWCSINLLDFSQTKQGNKGSEGFI
jgi:hypothetical protein